MEVRKIHHIDKSVKTLLKKSVTNDYIDAGLSTIYTGGELDDMELLYSCNVGVICVGYALLIKTKPGEEKSYDLLNLYIDPLWRNCGLGTLFMHELNNLGSLSVTADARNPIFMRIIERLSFKPVSRLVVG